MARANRHVHDNKETAMDAMRNFNEYCALTATGLTRGSVMRIENPRGKQVHVERGALWITQEGDTNDVVIESGQTFRFDRDGLALVSACGRAPLCLISFA
jgi:hypothetical protein